MLSLLVLSLIERARCADGHTGCGQTTFLDKIRRRGRGTPKNQYSSQATRGKSIQHQNMKKMLLKKPLGNVLKRKPVVIRHTWRETAPAPWRDASQRLRCLNKNSTPILLLRARCIRVIQRAIFNLRTRNLRCSDRCRPRLSPHHKSPLVRGSGSTRRS